MKFKKKEKNRHEFFAIKPKYCSGCGKYFFLEKGSRHWSGLIRNPNVAEDFGPVYYYCKECTKTGNRADFDNFN